MPGFMNDVLCRAAVAVRGMGIDRRGVTALEYGLIAALIAVAIIIGVQALGTQLNAAFNAIATQISSAVGGSP